MATLKPGSVAATAAATDAGFPLRGPPMRAPCTIKLADLASDTAGDPDIKKIASPAIFLNLFEGAKFRGSAGAAKAATAGDLPFDQFARALTAAAAVNANDDREVEANSVGCARMAHTRESPAAAEHARRKRRRTEETGKFSSVQFSSVQADHKLLPFFKLALNIVI